MTKPILNIGDIDLMDFGSPGGKFKAKLGRMGPALGVEKLGVNITIVEPGKRAFPFHVHHAIEEMFYIIEGEGEYRFGEDTYSIKPGDLLSAPVADRNAPIRSSTLARTRSNIWRFRQRKKWMLSNIRTLTSFLLSPVKMETRRPRACASSGVRR